MQTQQLASWHSQLQNLFWNFKISQKLTKLRLLTRNGSVQNLYGFRYGKVAVNLSNTHTVFIASHIELPDVPLLSQINLKSSFFLIFIHVSQILFDFSKFNDQLIQISKTSVKVHKIHNGLSQKNGLFQKTGSWLADFKSHDLEQLWLAEICLHQFQELH